MHSVTRNFRTWIDSRRGKLLSNAGFERPTTCQANSHYFQHYDRSCSYHTTPVVIILRLARFVVIATITVAHSNSNLAHISRCEIIRRLFCGRCMFSTVEFGNFAFISICEMYLNKECKHEFIKCTQSRVASREILRSTSFDCNRTVRIIIVVRTIGDYLASKGERVDYTSRERTSLYWLVKLLPRRSNSRIGPPRLKVIRRK